GTAWSKDIWLAFREIHEVGYRYVEAFIGSFLEYYNGDKPEQLQKRMDGLGVHFATISNGSPMETHFEDPARHDKIIEEHLRLVRFIKRLGCKHLKINTGGRRPTGTTDEDLKHMAAVLNDLGRRINEEGLKFGVHAHMWSQFENRREIDYIMANTDPKHIMFVLDTGHINMAGIDPVELARTLGHRVLEYHLKDTKKEWLGGAKGRVDHPDMQKDPPFFPLGHGGVDFVALKAHLDKIGWRGWMVVQLDSSPGQPPKEAARVSAQYIQKTLGLKL
ncbi:MAG TPA: sugar phosphate isomerase/epimerase, partial [Bryobacterales bacterium]|nr:sugar phosphate isomerase/epimerase [Bryobacterales bacterium]